MEKKNHEFSCFKWRYIKGLRVTVRPLYLHCCLLLIPRSRSMKSFETYEGQHSNLIFFSHKMFILMRLERTSNQSFLGNMTTFAFLQLLNYFLLLIDQILTFTVELLSQIEIKWNPSHDAKEDLHRKLDFSVILLIETTSAGMKWWHAK